jgi:DNA-binding response OmpR family regulator
MKKLLLINPVSDALAWDNYFLARDELQIFTATGAEEGLGIHRREKVNLLITELELPDMAGDELCSHIRQEQELREVSVIIVCRDLPEEIERAKTCGANGRLLKPVTPEQLEECVGKHLDVPKRQDCRVLVRAQLYGEHGATTLFCTSRNISTAGLLLESDGLLAAGDRISCMLFLPSARQITAIGEVVRITRLSRLTNQYGIRFISLNPQALAEIETFVAANVQTA